MIVNLDGSDFRDIRRSAQKQPDFRTVTMTCTTLRPGDGTCDGVGFKLLTRPSRTKRSSAFCAQDQ